MGNYFLNVKMETQSNLYVRNKKRKTMRHSTFLRRKILYFRVNDILISNKTQ